jgi:hypothetical protein
LVAALLAFVVLVAAAMTSGRPNNELNETVRPPETTTTVSPTTTAGPTTTEASSPTTTLSTQEALAGEIGLILASLQPPEFKAKDVRKVADRLDDVVRGWQNGKDEELARDLERAFEAVADLDDSAERDQLNELLMQLAESMGFQVERRSEEDEDD